MHKTRSLVLSVLGLLAACGNGGVGPFAGWDIAHGSRDKVVLTSTGAVLDLSWYGTAQLTKRMTVPPGTKANISADFRMACTVQMGQLGAGVGPDNIDKWPRLDSKVLGVKNLDVSTDFYYQVTAVNSWPQDCVIVVLYLTTFETP